MATTAPLAADWLAGEDYSTLPAEWYTDPAVFRAEQREILAKTWIYACHLDEVAEPGQVHAVEAGDSFPVIVTRDGEGELHAFFNVCRHRGHLLVSESGSRSSIQCPYHAWTYGLDGCLRGVPRGEEDPGLERRELGLRELRLAVWGSLVFVCADDSAPGFESWAAPVQAALDEAGIDLGAYRFKGRSRHVVEANWKVFVENSVECYHCPVAHPGFSSRVETRPEAMTVEQLGDGPHGRHVSSLKDGSGEFHFYLLWPVFMFSWVPGELGLIYARPLSVDRTLILSDYCYPDSAPAAEVEEGIAQGEQTLSEDVDLVANVQRGLSSGALERGRFLRGSEEMLLRFDRDVAAALTGQVG